MIKQSRRQFLQSLAATAALPTFGPALYSLTIDGRLLRQTSARPLPQWFEDAKLGIFIHWGIYSVPGYAPLSGELGTILADKEKGWPYWFANDPYAEWYANSLRIKNSPTAQYHAKTYGADYPYEKFVEPFNQALGKWDPAQMAGIFKATNARYVVLTTKHHDGFLMWPSKQPNPFRKNYMAARDVVGELTAAVRAAGMRMGLYYSGGLDWTFKDTTITDFDSLIAAIPQDKPYADYAITHWKELIDRYQPAEMWNDLGFPAVADLAELFAYYYKAVPDGVVNDRFNLAPENKTPHDFVTPEYAVFDEIKKEKWESTRGLGYSFGYNQLDGDANLLSAEALVRSFVDIVSKGGNLLLNIGPMADGTIPSVQKSRLDALGAFLTTNGEAIFGAKPYMRPQDKTAEGQDVRYTTNNGALYITVLDTPKASLTLSNLTLPAGATATLLGGGMVKLASEGGKITLTPPPTMGAANSPAYTFKVTPLA